MSEFTETELNMYFEYLIELRDSGRTNMWGAPMFLSDEMGVSYEDAKKVFLMWMDTFIKK